MCIRDSFSTEQVPALEVTILRTDGSGLFLEINVVDSSQMSGKVVVPEAFLLGKDVVCSLEEGVQVSVLQLSFGEEVNHLSPQLSGSLHVVQLITRNLQGQEVEHGLRLSILFQSGEGEVQEFTLLHNQVEALLSHLNQ